ncbi:phage protein NinX family protein [Pseudomonas bohemica]|uniref:phage protein NinX family protein n=1 Tax=Pseudomonas bohemica TaxID=2044872 RepID=UPI000DA60FDE|nr:phage protein NinX family protein [Pseudomonas bohemica]
MSEFVEVKTAELTGAALDWAVAKVEEVEGLVLRNGRPSFVQEFDPELSCRESSISEWKCWIWYQPSEDWRDGGPLIEKHRVGFAIYPEHYFAATGLNDSSGTGDGPTHLIAACRAIVASVLGETVSVPKELV